MQKGSFFTNIVVASGLFALAACSSQDPTPAPTATPAPAPAPAAAAKAEAAPAKAKATKIAGDVGLLDTEKNYMIIVTKEGKLVTIDYDAKFQPLKRTFENSKVGNIGLGSSATVTYTKQGDKNIATNIQYLPAKGE